MLVAPPAPSSNSVPIATALSDVDALLGGLDRLIAKKRDLNQAAQRQLLTGQTRLPGFHGEWEVKRLGDVGTFLKGSGVKKDEAESGSLPCIRYGEIYTHHNDYIRTFKSWISPDVSATATKLRQGDLLFAGSGETKEDIGKCVAFVNDYEAFAGGDIVILRVANADAMFMGYYFSSAPRLSASSDDLLQARKCTRPIEHTSRVSRCGYPASRNKPVSPPSSPTSTPKSPRSKPAVTRLATSSRA